MVHFFFFFSVGYFDYLFSLFFLLLLLGITQPEVNQLLDAVEEDSGIQKSRTTPANANDTNLNFVKEENERLKTLMNCKICFEREACMVLLPCGHQMCCDQCFAKIKKCPVCRVTILGKVKAFRA